MADIPITKKSGMPWWLWLIIAAAIVGLLLWLFAGNRNDERATPVASTVAGARQVADTAVNGPITDLTTVLSGGASVIGREVRLTNVAAGSVPTDAGFWITGDDGQREYVVLHEERTPNTPIEGMVNVNNGDRVDIVGTVRPAADGAPEGAAIPGPTKPLPEGITHFIEARTVTKTG